MASTDFGDSLLANGQAIFNQKYLSSEWRMPDSAAFSTAYMGQKSNPAIQELQTSLDRTVELKYPIRTASTGGTAKAARPTGNFGQSLSVDVTWSQFVETFAISVDLQDNNVIKYAEQYATSKQNAMYNLLDRVDSWYVTNLLSNKTQYSDGGGDGSFDDTTTYDYQVANGDSDYFFASVNAMMRNNLYRGGIVGVMDNKLTQEASRITNQGAQNATNLAYQVNGYSNLTPTTRDVLSSTTYERSGIFFENGAVGVAPWNQPKNRKTISGEKITSYNGDFGMEAIPGLDGVMMDVRAYSDVVDTSGNNGTTQDLKTFFEYTITVGFVIQPLSELRGTGDSVIYTAGILN